MAPATLPLTRGDRAPNFLLPDRRDIAISLYDKVKGDPVIVFFYPSEADADAAAELRKLIKLAPDIAAAGAHLFAVAGDPVATVAALAARVEPAFYLVADADGTTAAAYGAAGACVTFLLDPNCRILARLAPGDAPLAEQALTALRDLPRSTPYKAGPHPPVLLIPDVFDTAFCRYLIDQFAARGHAESGTLRVVDGAMVKAANHAIKRRRDHHVIDADLMNEIGALIGRRVTPEIRRAFHSEITWIEEFKIVRYDAEPGGYFRPHRDNTTPGTAHRRFAMTLNLNAEDYEGGELRFPEYGGATYKPVTGAAVVFSCNLLHEATSVTAGQRYVLLSFMCDAAGQQRFQAYQQARAARAKATG